MQVEGVSYDIDWAKFRKGRSIFLPCLNYPKVKDDLHAMFMRLGMRVLVKVIIEDGVKGLRIWRL
jgi:hypothetical protein